MVNEIALKTVLFITSSFLLPSHLPVTVAKAEFMHEDGNSCSSACSQAVLLHNNQPGMVQVCSGHWCVCFSMEKNREKQWEQEGKGNGALEPQKIYFRLPFPTSLA